MRHAPANTAATDNAAHKPTPVYHPEYMYAQEIKRPESLPLEHLIEKFHRIKEQRFKPKEQFKFSRAVKTSSLESLPVHIKQKHADDIQHAQYDRSTSGTVNMQKFVENARKDGRRMSLPSIIHPILNLPEQWDSDVLNLEANIPAVTHVGRRHSVSHVIGEYAKQNIHELSKLHVRKLKELNRTAERTLKMQTHQDSDVIDGSLSGRNLHAYYNMWEKLDTKHAKKHLHSRYRLPPLSRTQRHSSEDDEKFQRPRLFSM